METDYRQAYIQLATSILDVVDYALDMSRVAQSLGKVDTLNACASIATKLNALVNIVLLDLAASEDV